VDCDDTEAEIFPGAEDVCDGLDNDCDGETDEGIAEVTCGLGECARTVRCENGTMPACVPGEPSQDICDGLDNNCDGEVDNHDIVILHDVSIDELKSFSGGCDLDAPTHFRCQEGIDRFCQAQACTQSGFGPIALDGEIFRIACVSEVQRYTATFLELLFRSEQSCGERGKLDKMVCLRAFHDHCTERRFISGFGPIDVDDNEIGIACLPRGAVLLERTFDLFRAADEICDMRRRPGGGRVLGCNRAIHRICQNEGHISGYGPIRAHADEGLATIVCLSDEADGAPMED